MNIDRYICGKNGNLLKEQAKVLARICPKAFVGQIAKRGWKRALCKVQLNASDKEALEVATEIGKKRIGQEKKWRNMFSRAKMESCAKNPHEKFCKLIGMHQGVEVTDIQIKSNNDTTITFFYKGNNVSATCNGEPLRKGDKFLPTHIILNGKEMDVTGIDIRDVLDAMPAKKKLVYRKV